MKDKRTIDDLKKLGAGNRAPDHIVQLYRQAFDQFGGIALWNRKPSKYPTIAQALVIAQGLRREGNMACRPLAARIEEACRAAL